MVDTALMLTVIDILICTVSFWFNVLVVSFNWPQRKCFVPLLYTLISLSDSILTLTVLVKSSIWLYTGDEVEKISENLLWAGAVITATIGIASRVSIFLNVLLCVSRSIKILFPFYRIRQKLALCAVVVTAVFWVGIVITDFAILIRSIVYLQASHMILAGYSLRGVLGASIGGVVRHSSWGTAKLAHLVLLFFIAVPFIIPSIISLVCLMFLFNSLLKSVPLTKTGAVSQKYVTVTITMLTVAFAVCNGASTVYFIVEEIILDNHIERGPKARQLILYPLFNLTLPVLNGLASPIILISRNEHLRRSFRSSLRFKMGQVEHDKAARNSLTPSHTNLDTTISNM